MFVPAAARLVEFPSFPNGHHIRVDGSAPLVRANGASSAASRADAHQAEIERSYRSGYDAAEAECQAKIEEGRATIEARLADERKAWTAEQGSALAEQLASGLRSLTSQIEDTVAAILAPLIEGSLRDEATADLARTLQVLLTGGRHGTFRISGPADLVESLRRKLGSACAPIEFNVTDDAEVRVIADQTVIETQLQAWLGRVRKPAE